MLVRAASVKIQSAEVFTRAPVPARASPIGTGAGDCARSPGCVQTFVARLHTLLVLLVFNPCTPLYLPPLSSCLPTPTLIHILCNHSSLRHLLSRLINPSLSLSIGHQQTKHRHPPLSLVQFHGHEI